ncbi:MAG: F-type H+-transporting ATPase subunit epsilon [Chloroflexi bacterium]|jgi:F-type H+-transporting ATPase subunit epsilon|nr:MAG: F-type H+-transporting ATPase subunit epsilon [Chloroflexota bacterium]
MAKLTLEIITGEQLLLREEEIDEVVAPGSVGELGILPQHAPLVTSLQAGSLRVKRSGGEDDFFISGGFLEVRENEVKVLADSAERGTEIDLERAEEARERAESRLRGEESVDRARAEGALRRSLIRLKVGRRRRRGRADMAPGAGGAE